MTENNKQINNETKQTKKKNNKKKAWILGLAASAIVGLGAGGYTYTAYANGHFTELSFSKNKLEYGEKVDFNKLCKTEGVKLVKNNYKSEKLGKQKVKFEVQQGQHTFDKTYLFTVIDTQAPTLELKEEKVTITEGDKFDLQSNIKTCKDNTGEKLEPKFEGKVDTKKKGKYNITVSATDKSKNKTTVKFTVEVKEKKKEDKTENTIISSGTNKHQSGGENSTYVAPGKQHGINPGAIIGEQPRYAKYYDVLNAMRNGQLEFVFASREEWNAVIGDIMYDYFGLSDAIGMITYDEPTGFRAEFTEDDIPAIQQAFVNADVNWAGYRNAVVGALNGMNLRCSDYEMVNQINRYLVNNYSYVITDAPLYDFTQRGIGQCYHYANMFRDLCLAVGIQCEYVTGNNHAWNIVTVDGVRYKFDSTWNDTTGSVTGYSWIRV